MKVFTLMMTFSPISIRLSSVEDPIVRQKHRPALLMQLQKPRADSWFMLEYVETRTAELAVLQQVRQRLLVHDLATGRVDEDRVGLHQGEPPARQEVIGRGRMRAIYRNDIHAGEHPVEAVPIGRIQLLLDALRGGPTVVVVDLETECPGAFRQRIADPAKSDDPEPLAADPLPQHPARRPAFELSRCDGPRSIHEPARNGHDERHREIRHVIGQDAGRVRDGDAAGIGGPDVDIVDAVAEIGDQLEA